LDISISKKKPLQKQKMGISRRFEDGTVEVQFGSGYRARRKPFYCLGCGAECVEHGLNVNSARLLRAKLCAPCFDAERQERVAAIVAERAARRLLGETPAQRRYVALVLATPEWRDRQAIANFYVEAARLTAVTGVLHEVDHIYPIQSEFGCGLHVHQNLQILDKHTNRSKKNAFPMHDSPALWEDKNSLLPNGRTLCPNQASS
jgi:hypothetical protein